MADVHAYLIEQGWLCVRQSSGASNSIGDCAITYCVLCGAESDPDEALDVKRHEDHCPVPAVARGWEAERLLRSFDQQHPHGHGINGTVLPRCPRCKFRIQVHVLLAEAERYEARAVET